MSLIANAGIRAHERHSRGGRAVLKAITVTSMHLFHALAFAEHHRTLCTVKICVLGTS